MEFRQLTLEEIEGFLDRHGWFGKIWFVPEQGKYIQDTVLGGYVLVFEKQDGSYVYIWTIGDPTINDPSSIEYITSETWEAIKDNTRNVAGVVTTGLKISTPILILVVIIIFRNELKTILKQVLKQ